MASENVQIEQFENTVANTQLKQLSWQIDPSNPAESTGSYKAQSGAVLTLLSSLKVQELINAGVASATGVFVIVSDVASLIIALEEPQVLNIWWNGEDIDTTPIVASILSDKNIYCNSPDSLSFATTGFEFTFPTSLVAGETAFVNFYNGLTSVGAIVDTVGGVSSSTTGIRITTQRGGNTLGATVSANAPIIIENLDMPSASSIANVISGLWSGLNQTYKPDQNTQAYTSTDGTYNTTREVAVKGVATSSVEYFSENVDLYKFPNTRQRYKRYLIDTGTGFNVNQKIELGNAIMHHLVDTGNLGINTTVYPWTIPAIDLHENSASYDNGTDSGTTHNAYYGGSTPSWRAKATGTCQRIEFESNGDKVEYTSASTTVDLVITWIETKRTTKEGTIYRNEATVINDLYAGYDHEIRTGKVISTNQTNGAEIITWGCYRATSGNYKATTTDGLMIYFTNPFNGTINAYVKASPNVIGTEYTLGSFTLNTIV